MTATQSALFERHCSRVGIITMSISIVAVLVLAGLIAAPFFWGFLFLFCAVITVLLFVITGSAAAFFEPYKEFVRGWTSMFSSSSTVLVKMIDAIPQVAPICVTISLILSAVAVIAHFFDRRNSKSLVRLVISSLLFIAILVLSIMILSGNTVKIGGMSL